MNYSKFRHLLPDERIEAYKKEIEAIRVRLASFGLGLDNSCIACDYILSLSIHEHPSLKRIKYRGVYKRKNGTYYSKITKGGEYIFLGNFKDIKDAALIYDLKSYELYKDKNRLNFPELINKGD